MRRGSAISPGVQGECNIQQAAAQSFHRKSMVSWSLSCLHVRWSLRWSVSVQMVWLLLHNISIARYSSPKPQCGEF